MSRWEQDMNARPLEEKETPEGKRFTYVIVFGLHPSPSFCLAQAVFQK